MVFSKVKYKEWVLFTRNGKKSKMHFGRIGLKNKYEYERNYFKYYPNSSGNGLSKSQLQEILDFMESLDYLEKV